MKRTITSDEFEEWRPIKDYEGIYEVSSYGRVKSLPRQDARGHNRNGKLLSPGNYRGYPFVNLCKDGIPTNLRVHFLVAQTFIGDRETGYEVKHKDHITTNNRKDNLEWVTHQEILNHAGSAGLLGKLSAETVRAIRSLISRNPTTDIDVLAHKLKCHCHTIQSIVDCESYQLLPNKDGSMPVPLLSIPIKHISIEDIEDLQVLGFTLPEIASHYGKDKSTPYRVLHRAGIWQTHSKLSTRKSGRKPKVKENDK